jgi:YafQ family addiction module toxin component
VRALSWSLELSPDFERDYAKLCGRNAGFRRAVDRKIEQILRDPLHYKPLRGPLQGFRRVHVVGSYVLIFQPIEASEVVRFVTLAHHDHAYRI